MVAPVVAPAAEPAADSIEAQLAAAEAQVSSIGLIEHPSHPPSLPLLMAQC